MEDVDVKRQEYSEYHEAREYLVKGGYVATNFVNHLFVENVKEGPDKGGYQGKYQTGGVGVGIGMEDEEDAGHSDEAV